MKTFKRLKRRKYFILKTTQNLEEGAQLSGKKQSNK